MRLRRHHFIGAAVCIGSALLITACNNGSVTQLTAPPTTNASLTLTVQHTPDGNIIATGNGDTLYDFLPDTPQHSACLNDGCVFQWPPLIKDGPITLGPGLKRSLLGTLRRPDGSTQISYGGHPLYSYNLDVEPGLVTGQAIDQNGGLWYVISPSGKQITTPFSVTKG